MAVRRYFDAATLTRLREMPAGSALELLCTQARPDASFHPVKHPVGRRWHASTARAEFEIVATGVKWYDTRAKRGGGGAIDLAMHLLGLSFVDAVKHLVVCEEQHGPDHP